MQDSNSIPTQTFAEEVPLNSAYNGYDGEVAQAESLLKQVGSAPERSIYNPGNSNNFLFGKSVVQIFVIAALMLALIIGVAVAGILRNGNSGGNNGDGQKLLASASISNQKSQQQQDIDNSVIQINRTTVINKNFTAAGDVLIQSDANSAKAFKIQNSNGDNILVADTANKQINIGDKPPGQVSLNVQGDITTNGALVSTAGYSLSSQGLTIGGVLVCTANGCISSSSPPPTPTSPTIDVANLMFLNTNQTISGAKTFNASTTFNANVTVNAPVQVAGNINSTTGFSVGGVAGDSFSCGVNELLQQAVISGGIITSGTCVTVAGSTTPTLQDVYDASTPASVVLSNASGVFDIQDAASPLATNLFQVGSNGNSTLYFAVNNLGISVTGNVSTTGQYQVGGVQISSANLSNDANLAKLSGNQTFSGNNSFTSAGNSFTGSGAGLTSLNASNISTGTLSDTRLSNNVALLNALQSFTGQNTFSNAANSFTGSGAGLTSLNASNVSSGTLNDARLSGNVTLQGNTFNGANQLVQLTAGGILPILNGSNLTSLNATNISSGTLNDARLSSNVALLSANNIFLGNDSFHLNSTALTVQDAVTPLGADLFTVTDNSGATKYFEVSATTVKVNGNDVCTSAGNCVGTGGGGAIGGSGTAGKIAKFTGSGFTIGDSLLSESGSLVAINGSINLTAGNTYQVNGSQISSANLSNDSNLAKLNGTQTFTGANTFSNASNSFTGSGSGLTSLNASNVSSGTLSDARLSSNVALKNTANTFTGNNIFSLNTAGLAVQDAASPLGTNLFEVTDNAGTTKYFTVSATALQFNGNDVCTAAGNCTGTGGGGAIGGSGTAGKLAKFTGSGFTIGDSLISDNGSTVTVGGSLAVNTISPTATLTIGVASQTLILQGDASTSLSATASGIKSSLVFATPTLTNKTITIPNASGTVAVSASGPLALDAAGNLTCPSCLTTNGSGGGSGVSSINSLSGAITLAGTANQVIITPAGNTLTLSLPQDIATSSTPTFANINISSGGLYEINGTQISSAALSNDANLAKLNGTQSFTGANTFNNASNSFTGDGTGLTNVDAAKLGGQLPSYYTDASNISSGTLNDGRLSANVALLNATQTFSGNNIFQTATNSATAFEIQDNSGSSNLFVADTTTNRIAINQASSSYALGVNGSINGSTVYQNGNQVCDTSGNCVGVSGGAIGGSGTAGKLTKFTGSGFTIGDSLITDNGISISVAGDVNTTGQYQVNGSQIASSNLADASNIAYLNGSGPQTFTGNNKFAGTILSQNTSNSTTAFQVQTSGSSAVLTADTANSRIGVDVTYSAMGTPAGLAVGAATSGGSLTASTTYFYKVTAIDSAGGETTASTEASGSTGIAPNQTLPVTWTAVTGASGYRVYRATTSGSEVYLTSVITNSFTDSGSIAAGTGAPPASNTAYVSTNNSNNNLQLTVGGNGTPTGQLYVGGTIPSAATSTTKTNTSPYGIAVSGNYTYIINNGSATLQTFDTSNPASPVLMSTISTGSHPLYIVISGRYAYVDSGTGSNSIQTFDLSNPASPVLVSTISASTIPVTEVVQGRYLYVALNSGNLRIYDLVNPASPVQVAAISTAGPNDLAVQGRYAYVTSRSNGGSATMQIFDVANPKSPVSVSTTNVGGAVTATQTMLAVKGRYAYIFTNQTSVNADMEIYDVSNPAAPTLVSTTSTGASGSSAVYRPIVSGQYVYAANYGSATLQTFNVSNPASPSLVGTAATANNPSSLIVQGRYAYTTNFGNASFQIFDLGGTYTQTLQVGSTQTTSLFVGADTSIVGNASIQGGATVGGGLQVAGQVGINGSLNLSASTLSAPGAPTLASSGTGGTLAAATYYYKLAAINSNVTTQAVASSPASVTTSGSTSSNTLSWSSVSGATGYIVYRSTDNATWFVNNLPSTATSLVDNGTTYTWATSGTPLSVTDGGGNLAVNGFATFKNTVNSTTAFQIQNSSGTNLLTADTTNGYIQVGSSTTDATAVLNVLDSYNNGTDPTGVNGAMYYNTSLNAFRCFQNSVWVNCAGSGAGTLSASYNAGSSSADQTLNLDNAKGGGIIIKDNSTPITGSLFTIQNSGGTTKFLDVTSAKITVGENTVGNATATATTATTSGTGTNTTTVALTAVNSLANGDVIFIDNAGQDYFTRITAGGGTTSLTVDPAVTYENARTVTKYNVQYLGSDGTNFSGATRNQNSFYQGYFLGGVVTGAGSTVYSDANIQSINNLQINTATGVNVKGTNSTTAFQVQNSSGANLLNIDSTNMQISLSQSGLSLSDLSAPSSPGVAAGATTGGTLSGAAGTTYYYKITAMSGTGESLGSSEVSINGQGFTKLSAPGAPNAAVGAAGNVTGSYTYKVTFITANGETTAGTASSVVSPSAQQVSLTAIPTGPTGTTGRNVYRCDNAGANCLRMTAGTTLANNTTTTLTDNTTSYTGNPADPGANTATTNTNNATVTWTAVSGATGYRVYRGTAAGAESAYQTTSASPFTDTGVAGTAGTVHTYSTIDAVGIGTSTPAANLDVEGTGLFKNAANSTSAFQVQDSSGVSVLNIDTTNRVIGINNTAATATLDVSASAVSYFEGFESGTTGSFSGALWTASTTNPHTGSYSIGATSGGVGTLTVTKSMATAGTVSFWANIQSGCCATPSTFKIDGATQQSWSPNTTTPWTFYSFAVSSGSHTYTWAFNNTQPAYWYIDDFKLTQSTGSAYAAAFNNGNVGIGTSAPGSTLEVDGTAAFKLPTTANAFQIQNTSGAQILTADPTTNSISIAQGNLSVSGLSNITSVPTLASSLTGGSLAAATYYYEVSAVNVNGSTPAIATNPTSVTTTGTTSQNTVTWAAKTNASGYNVYRSTNGTTWFVNTVGSTATSLVDNGTTYSWSSASAPPTANTTGGNLSVKGAATFTNASNSTSALDVQDATGDSILRVDSTDRHVGINNSAPVAALDVVASAPAPDFTWGFEDGTYGAISHSGRFDVAAAAAHTGSYAWVGDTCGNSGDTMTLTRSLGSAGYISFWAQLHGFWGGWNVFWIDGVAKIAEPGGTIPYALYTFPLSAGSHTFQWNTGDTCDYIYVDDITVGTNAPNSNAAVFNGGNVGIGTVAPSATLETDGTSIFKATSNVTSTLQVQNATGDSLLNADTTNSQITIGRFVDGSLSAPASPGVSAGANTGGTLLGAAGTTYYYKVSAMTVDGETPLSSEVSINGQSFTKLSAPGAATVGTPSAGGSVDLGLHSYKVTFITANGETTGGTTSSQVNVTSGGTQTVPLTAIPTGPAGTTQRKIYRTVAGDTGNYLLVTTIANNTTTTYNDTTADASLGVAAPASNTATTSTNNATITWSAVTGATSYRVYRGTASGAETAYQTTSASPFTDTGAAGTSLTNSSLAIKGTTSAQNVIDSTTAFQIQNASGSSLFTVDTTNNKITLGAPSATPVLLVLGTKNTSGDPTCSDGAIYYNSNTKRFRACTNGTWATFGAYAPGYELSYDQITSNVSLSATTEAAANTAITSTSVTYDGSTVALVEVYVPNMSTANSVGLGLWLDGTEQFGHLWATNAGGDSGQVTFRTRVTLTAGSHTITVRGWDTGGTGTLNAGTGIAGANTYPPAYVRVVVAQ